MLLIVQQCSKSKSARPGIFSLGDSMRTPPIPICGYNFTVFPQIIQLGRYGNTCIEVPLVRDYFHPQSGCVAKAGI